MMVIISIDGDTMVIQRHETALNGCVQYTHVIGGVVCVCVCVRVCVCVCACKALLCTCVTRAERRGVVIRRAS